MIAVWIVLGVVAVLVISFVFGFNHFVRLRNEVNTGWSNIDVQLKRRADLIPNLVEAVKGYAAHERGVFDSITEARSSLLRADTPGAAAQANDVLTTALGRLFAVAEAYPDLKASQNFLRLQDELTDTEDKIAAARRYYNTVVRQFNTSQQTFPSSIVARSAGFQLREFFRLEDEGERRPVSVGL